MVASVFELRQGVDMPKTIAELYESASDAMLARGGVVSAEVRALLEAVFFEAHVKAARVITEVQLLRAALGKFAPEGTLEELDRELASPFTEFTGRAGKGHYVEVVKQKWKGQRGVISADDGSRNPYIVTFDDGSKTDWLYPQELKSSGFDQAAFMAKVDAEHMPALTTALTTAVKALPTEAREAVRAVRERVARDGLPLLSLLQAEPLEMQSSHLSFQEYFAASAICSGKYRLPEGLPPPWQLPAFWANVVKLGGEMGATFGEGLRQAAGLGATLDLEGKLGGHQLTACAAVAQMARGLTSLDLSGNKLGAGEAKVVAAGLAVSGSLSRLLIGRNAIGDKGCIVLAEAMQQNDSCKIEELSLSHNQIGVAGAKSLAAMIAVRRSLSSIDLSENYGGPEFGKAIAVGIRDSRSLNVVDTRKNDIDGEAAKELAAAVLAISSMVTFGGVPIKELRTNALTTLDLSHMALGPTEAIVLAGLLPVSRSLAVADLRFNQQFQKFDTECDDARCHCQGEEDLALRYHSGPN